MTARTWRSVIVLLLGILPAWLLAEQPSNEREFVSGIEKRIQDWQPTRDERLFDQIGWAKDIREALALGAKHKRPVFLFTYDGANMACYRC
jgi:hypothetical protein